MDQSTAACLAVIALLLTWSAVDAVFFSLAMSCARSRSRMSPCSSSRYMLICSTHPGQYQSQSFPKHRKERHLGLHGLPQARLSAAHLDRHELHLHRARQQLVNLLPPRYRATYTALSFHHARLGDLRRVRHGVGCAQRTKIRVSKASRGVLEESVERGRAHAPPPRRMSLILLLMAILLSTKSASSDRNSAGKSAIVARCRVSDNDTLRTEAGMSCEM
jgi:hypothetical protein